MLIRGFADGQDRKRAGFATVFLPGTTISNNFLAEPDLGFLNFEQVKSHAEQILLSANVNFIIDFDLGYDAKLAVRQAKLLNWLGVGLGGGEADLAVWPDELRQLCLWRNTSKSWTRSMR